MTKDQVKAVLDRLLTWPRERQEDVAQMLTLMEEQDKSTLRLTDEQAAEIPRRLANPSSNRISCGRSLQALSLVRRMKVTFEPAAP